MERTDEELIAAIARRGAGADGSFDELCGRHEAALRRRLLQIVRCENTTEDLLQEVFLRLWLRAGQFDGRGSVAGWLLRMATNLALNEIRANRRRRQQPLDAAQTEDEDANPAPGWLIDAAGQGPEEATDTAERAELLSRIVASMPPDKQAVFRLVHEQDRELKAAAEELGIPYGTAKSRLHYARRLLVEKWQQAYGPEDQTHEDSP